MNWLQTISIVPQFCGYETVKIQTVKFLHENSPPCVGYGQEYWLVPVFNRQIFALKMLLQAGLNPTP